jgi:hypothetical protein
VTTTTDASSPPADVLDVGVNTPVDEDEDDDQVLDLVSIAPARRPVKIPTKRKPEGEPFTLRLMDDFGIEIQQQLMSWGRRYDALFNKEDDLTADERTKLKYYLDCIFDQVLDAPKSIKKDIPDGVRSRVVTAFTLAPLLARQEAEQRAQMEAENDSSLPTSES